MDWFSPDEVKFMKSLLKLKVDEIMSTTAEEKGFFQENKEAPTKSASDLDSWHYQH